MKNRQSLVIGWLYPELMNIYGDRGNVIVLQKRCEWRDIQIQVLKLDVGFAKNEMEKCDIILMGGAQDKQQKAVIEDLLRKSDTLKMLINKGIPGLYICGAYQTLGNYYQLPDGSRIPGLGIFDLYTKSPGDGSNRLIGNIISESELVDEKIVGFENHGGRTYLSKNMEPFGKVIKGFGNNGEDETEGILYKNSIGTYLHGPLLSKNPLLADYLIKQALEIKYKTKVPLKALEDSLENQARIAIAKRLSVAI